MTDLQKQFVIQPEDSGVIALSDEINHLYGATAAKLTRPTGARYLVMQCESGNFRMQLGDKVGTISAATPGASVVDGTGSWKLGTSKEMVLPAPVEITVKGDGATALLTYFWL